MPCVFGVCAGVCSLFCEWILLAGAVAVMVTVAFVVVVVVVVVVVGGFVFAESLILAQDERWRRA